MNLFDQLVTQALKNKAELSPLRMVVEKELLHHDIIREMSGAGFLDTLTFIGGTCLRACYGSNRLSEDLDFTGGKSFKREILSDLGGVLVDKLEAKYGLQVSVDAPLRIPHQTGPLIPLQSGPPFPLQSGPVIPF